MTSPEPDRRRFALLCVAPVMVLLVAAVWPLVSGRDTLVFRDVFNTHLPAKAWLADAEQALPLVNPRRDGGQPLLGNPNASALYPTSLLLAVAPLFWAFNAHFWLHLLAAPWAMSWLARVQGVGRVGAWAAGVAYAGSGFFLSSLNLHNLVGGLTLAPALVAATLRLAAARRPARWTAAVAALWALLILAGDPMSAVLALVLAVAAVVLARRGAALATPWPAAAVGLGTLVAAPQVVEFLRVLPLSYRGHWGFSPEAAAAASWHPATAIEWLLPLAFGGPGLAFWGERWFGGDLPLFFSLAPGAAVLALVAASGRPRTPAARWAWAAIAGGVFLALGGHNPVVGWLLGLPGAGLLRLPVKLWLAVALGASLLAGIGFERAWGGGRRGFGRALGLVAGVAGGLWLALSIPASGRGLLARFAPPAAAAGWLEAERLRWAGLALAGLVLSGLLALLWRLGRRWPTAAAGAFLALHLGSQLFLLRPLLASDRVEVYRAPPPLLALVPPESRIVHAAPDGLFGPVPIDRSSYPDARPHWLQRLGHQRLLPASGQLFGRRYELTASPEGLDAFLSRAAAQALPPFDDAARLRLLRAWGVDRLLLTRPLDAGGPAELLHREGEPGEGLWLYALPRLPEVRFVATVHRAPHLNAALALLAGADFDPLAAAVLPGEGPAERGAGGTVRLVASGPERLAVEVDAAGPGALVVQRVYLPLYRATVDGRPAPLVAADLWRLGLELPAGRHRVRIWIDRRPLRLALAAAGLGLLAIVWLAWSGRRPAGASPAGR